MNAKQSVIALALLVATAGAAAPSDTTKQPELEPIGALDIEKPKAAGAPYTVTFNANSGGCTGNADFRLEIQKSGDAQTLKVIRLKEDVCEAYFPSGARIKLTTSDLAVDLPVVVANPIFVHAPPLSF